MNQRQIAQRWYRQQDLLVKQFIEQALPYQLYYTPAEFEQIQQVSSIVREAMREGVVLYQADGSLTTVS
ncbi:MAG: hypothetical protein NZL85_10905 [Fimbriimonadales bacterium]|nr:hypothetical protein [Fimbriimonadales bacterium]